MGIINRPVRFSGSKEERAANRRTHHFIDYGEESECANCVCKPWHVAADYPCGTEPPRETIEYGD